MMTVYIINFFITLIIVHQQMATDYVDAIASALQEYQPGLPQQVYEDLAWGGLIGTPVFDDTNTPLTPNDRIRIANRYEAEQRSLSIGDIPNTQNPISQPCN